MILAEADTAFYKLASGYAIRLSFKTHHRDDDCRPCATRIWVRKFRLSFGPIRIAVLLRGDL